ncbi:MAG: leucyl/phenylalanyl-tRNA--protein transferase [Pseudomonadota bacterium]
MITRLGQQDDFPPSSSALRYPNGLIAESDGFSTALLLRAYRRGIFPWNSEPPVRWWTPEPRSLLLPQAFHLPRKLRKTLMRETFHLSVDRCFSDVMALCGLTRIKDSGLQSMDSSGEGTWLGPAMIEAYSELHRLGHAHSIETWTSDGKLAGGLYGVCVGGAFFGESMFSLKPDASKVALVALMSIMQRAGFDLLDCQMETDFLNSFGARNFSRLDFEQRLAQTVDRTVNPDVWRLPTTCGDLL